MSAAALLDVIAAQSKDPAARAAAKGLAKANRSARAKTQKHFDRAAAPADKS